jgi:photosystem II stability/assembly factor-like uncharacterized protein
MKKNLLLFLALLFSMPCLFAQYNWQTLPNAPKSWRNDDIYFLNSQVGWAIHAYYVYPPLVPNQFGQIYKTTDGGNTWLLLKDSSKTFYRCVGFSDSLTGWVGNLADTEKISGVRVTSDTIPLYQTTNGGKTFTPVNFPNPSPKGICGISVASDSVIYAYGRYFGPPILAKTTDKGKTWKTYDMSVYASVGLIDGWFWNKDTGFITGQDGANAVILRTNDGGTTWQTMYHATRNDSDHVWKIFFPSRDTGYGSLECLAYSQTKRYFVKTTDGGKTWTEFSFPINSYDEEGIGFINDTIGWIGGDECGYNYITYDGGKNWTPDIGFGIATPPYVVCYSSSGSAINRFRKINDTLMYASGNTVYKLSGTITGIQEMQNKKSSISNYPNPFSGQTTISYTLPKPYRALTLDIFDNIGNKVFSKYFMSQGVGQHSFIFNLKLQPGVYIYTLTTDNDKITNKMEVVK